MPQGVPPGAPPAAYQQAPGVQQPFVPGQPQSTPPPTVAAQPSQAADPAMQWREERQYSLIPDANQAPEYKDDTRFLLAPDPHAQPVPNAGAYAGGGAVAPPPVAKEASFGQGFARHTQTMGLVIMIVCAVAILGGVVCMFIGTTRSPMDTVQHFWYWANRIDIPQMMTCWSPAYVKQHPEVQGALEGVFDNPDSPYMGGRLRTNSCDSLTYAVADVGGQKVVTTYAPSELTGKQAGTKDKLSEMVMVKEGRQYFITTVKWFE